MKHNYYNNKTFIYIIRGIGWISLPTIIHIGLFHREILDKHQILTLVFILIFLLTDFKVNYKKMKFSKTKITMRLICSLLGRQVK